MAPSLIFLVGLTDGLCMELLKKYLIPINQFRMLSKLRIFICPYLRINSITIQVILPRPKTKKQGKRAT